MHWSTVRIANMISMTGGSEIRATLLSFSRMHKKKRWPTHLLCTDWLRTSRSWYIQRLPTAVHLSQIGLLPLHLIFFTRHGSHAWWKLSKWCTVVPGTARYLGYAPLSHTPELIMCWRLCIWHINHSLCVFKVEAILILSFRLTKERGWSTQWKLSGVRKG